jgi:hypothetical protein
MTQKTYRQKLKLYRSKGFRSDVSGCLGLERSVLATCLDALTAAQTLPNTAGDLKGSAAAAIDAARILIGIGGCQTRPESIVRVTARIFSMQLLFKSGPPPISPELAAQGNHSKPAVPTFGMALASLFLFRWSLGSPFDIRVLPIVTIGWDNERNPNLFGIIKYNDVDKTEAVYSTASLEGTVFEEKLDFVQIGLVGARITSAESLVQFGRVMEAAVA